MITTRTSNPDDIPAMRRLWQLAFGDAGAYVDNFFNVYYQPERMLVLIENGVLRAMTAWFDTTFVAPGRGNYRAAYLYAVATHPDCRGRGLAGQLLAWADCFFQGLGIPAVTTVPAEPSLHNFFGANGFRECFQHFEYSLTPDLLPAPRAVTFRSVTPGAYGAAREALLENTPHIAYPEDALAYQAGCCALSGLSLCVADTPAGPVCLCPEDAGDGLVIIKEYLGCTEAKRLALSALPQIAPAKRWVIRESHAPDVRSAQIRIVPFAMLKWLDQEEKMTWNWNTTAHLGLAFD